MSGIGNSELQQNEEVDVVVIGGGIHGAAAARFCAAAGLSVVLLERSDFAGETSSRSSKMAHGGLRYLELFDFEQVFEGIKARESLFESAPHLVRPERFLIPVPRGNEWFKWKLKAGLILYDLFVRRADRRHRWIPRAELSFPGFDSTRADLSGCYLYCDGLMNDTRLVIENLLFAHAHGARSRNYADVFSLEHGGKGWAVKWRDQLSGDEAHLSAKIVLNCAGPWVGNVTSCGNLSLQPRVKFSRGVHLLFPVPWSGPSLFLPMPGRSRYYFVWPHQGGTMVGTTEREVRECEFDPIPWREEVVEIYERIQRDLRNTPLCDANAHYGFAGVRSIPRRVGAAGTATLSRKHLWLEENGMVSLAGGKYTTAYWTAHEGAQKACKLLGVAGPSPEERGAILPGACDSETESLLSVRLREAGYSNAAIARLIARLGARAIEVLKAEKGAEELSPGITAGEIYCAVMTEGAKTIEDIMRRRLELELLPGSGLDCLESIAVAANGFRPFSTPISEQIRRYRERILSIQTVVSSV